MNQLPTPVKWMLVLAVLAGVFAMLWLADQRTAAVPMPAPESWISPSGR